MTNKMKEFKEKYKENQKKDGVYEAASKNDITEEYELCRAFFDRLTELLQGSHVMKASCNKDLSAYLVPIGTEDQISYYGKPNGSFRVSDHWNWYSPLSKCREIDIVQCYCVNIQSPIPRDVNHPEKGTNARKACQVAYYGHDKKYHAVYGEIWDPRKKCYVWLNNTPENVAKAVHTLETDEGKNYYYWEVGDREGPVDLVV